MLSSQVFTRLTEGAYSFFTLSGGLRQVTSLALTSWLGSDSVFDRGFRRDKLGVCLKCECRSSRNSCCMAVVLRTLRPLRGRRSIKGSVRAPHLLLAFSSGCRTGYAERPWAGCRYQNDKCDRSNWVASALLMPGSQSSKNDTLGGSAETIVQSAR